MSISNTNLNRAVRKDGELSKKLVSVRKNRDGEAKKINRITKKKNITKSDLQRIERYQKNLMKYDNEITDLMEQIRKNNGNINKYKERIDKEQKREYDKMMRDLSKQTGENNNYIDKASKISKELNNLAVEVKHTAHEKSLIKYDVFLSHSSLDKEIFVTELSEKLSEKGLSVFEDIKVFKIGHSQTDMMNMGILNSRFVIVFLSPNFIKSGWSDYEFKSFLNREINEKRIIILPIWHDVSVEQVREYNPYLVDKFALSTEKHSVDEMVEHITQVISQSKEGD